MDPIARARLFDIHDAMDHPMVRGVVIALVAAIVLFPLLVLAIKLSGRASESLLTELRKRYISWLIFLPLMIGPILLGAAWTIGAVLLLSLFCYREFARAIGLFRHKFISVLVVLGIFAITLGVIDHWYGLFVAVPPLAVSIMAALAVLQDEPKGYIQRVALGVFAFLLFGLCFGHMSYLANDSDYRPILIWLILCVQMNDIFAFTCGKLFGRRKLLPNTSPNKTIGGSLGAIVLTTALAASLGRLVFPEGPLSHPIHLIIMGAMLSVAGQLGDLTLSSIKRDLGIKDWAATFPGHGGLLDRFNSLLFAAPAVFHYLAYFRGVGEDQPMRIFTGG